MGENVFEFWRGAPIVLSAIGQTIFVLFYSLRAWGAGKWWKDPTGRALFTKSATLVVLLWSINLAYVSRFINDEYTRVAFDLNRYQGNLEYLVVFGYWAVTFGVYYQLWALLKQRFFNEQITVKRT